MYSKFNQKKIKKIFYAFLICISPMGVWSEVPNYEFQDFLGTIKYSGADLSYDNSFVSLGGNESGILNIYTLPAQGGKKVQRTFSKISDVHIVSYFPQDMRLLFAKDKEGNELYRLFVLDTDNSQKNLIPDEKAITEFFDWNISGKKFFYKQSQPDLKAFDVKAMDIASYQSRVIWENDGSMSIACVSRDGKYIAIGYPVGLRGYRFGVYNTETKKLTEPVPSDPQVSLQPAMFSLDSKWLYFTSDKGSEFAYLNRVNTEQGTIEEVLRPDGGISGAYLSDKGKYLVVNITKGVDRVVKIYQMPEMTEVPLPTFEHARIVSSGTSKDEKAVLFGVVGSVHPFDYYSYFFDTKKLYRLTNSLNPKIDPANLVIPERVSYPSQDGMEIPALFYKPKTGGPDTKYPVLLYIHGGPLDHVMDEWDIWMQYIVNQGYALLAVNYRGGTGYGRSFETAFKVGRGVEDVLDCVWGKKYLLTRDDVDGSKIGILGGSYGGFIVLAAQAFYPGEFKVGIDLFGPSNWERVVKSLPPWWSIELEQFKERIGGKDFEQHIRKISPIFQVDKIQSPMLVVQGANDPRVLKKESDEVVASLKKNGVTVEYLVFEDEGHGKMSRNNNQILFMKTLMNFLKNYLVGND